MFTLVTKEMQKKKKKEEEEREKEKKVFLVRGIIFSYW